MKAGVPDEEAQIVSDLLARSDLRGIETHGVTRLPIYIKRLQKGYVRKRCKITFVKNNGPVAFAEARMIIVADINDAKLDMMKTFGATHFINNAKEDLKEKVHELTNGRGVDYAFEAIGTKKTQAETMEVTGKGGTSVFIGNESFFSKSLPTSPEHFALWSKNLLGILYGGCNPLTDIPKLLQLYKDGLLNLDDMITKEYRLEQVNEAFDDMLAGKNIRGVIRFD